MSVRIYRKSAKFTFLICKLVSDNSLDGSVVEHVMNIKMCGLAPGGTKYLQITIFLSSATDNWSVWQTEDRETVA